MRLDAGPPRARRLPMDDAERPSAEPEAFHEGEQAVQSQAGVRERLRELGPRVIRDYMPDQHRQFFNQLPFLLAATLDRQGQPWVSVLAGEPGFITSPTEHRLRICARPLPGDPLDATWPGREGAGLAPGLPIGLLGIEPHTRRRNRMNGVVDAVDADGFEVRVKQSFGNCPKYIQARQPAFRPRRAQHEAVVIESQALAAADRRLVGQADTFFIASAHPPSQALDVSHRGGRPGFVRVAGDRLLLAPDYAGNGFFNTLGNIAVAPRAGLLFIDFETGDCLHLAVHASIAWDAAQVAAVPGALRLLRLEVVQVRRVPAWLPLQWGAAEMSPHLP